MPPKNCKGSSSRTEYLSGMSNQPRHYPSVPRNRDILPTTGAFDSGIARLESAAMPGRHAASSIGAMTRNLFHHRPLDQDDRRICRSLAGVRRRPRYRRKVDAAVAHQPAVQSADPPEALAPWQIGYQHIAELGGLRGKSRGTESSPNTYWRVRSFRNYADYALTAPFAAGLARLRERGSEHRCVIMCAEAVWWRCTADHYRLPFGRSRASESHSRKIACRCGEPDTRRRRSQRRDGGLSRSRSASGMRQGLPPA